MPTKVDEVPTTNKLEGLPLVPCTVMYSNLDFLLINRHLSLPPCKTSRPIIKHHLPRGFLRPKIHGLYKTKFSSKLNSAPTNQSTSKKQVIKSICLRPWKYYQIPSGDKFKSYFKSHLARKSLQAKIAERHNPATAPQQALNCSHRAEVGEGHGLRPEI
jgi:hypothetical protein